MSLQALRSDIPVCQETTYLNYGSHGPSPRCVVEAATGILEYLEYETTSITRTTEALSSYERVRTEIADFIGSTPEEVALTESTTAGINRIVNALEWESGDTVVRTDVEHSAGILPLKQLKQNGISVHVVETQRGQIDTASFTEAVSDATLAVFSPITWTHGSRLPVSELADIATEAGTFTLVDAAQVPGQQPMNVHEWGVDAVAAAGHKWLLAPQGSGFLYINNDSAESLVPGSVGPRGVNTDSTAGIEYKRGARRFETGSTSLAAHVGLQEAIDTITDIGIGACETRIKQLTKRLKEGIPNERLLSPSAFHSGLVTIKMSQPTDVANELFSRDIVVRALPQLDAVRVSVHAISTEHEVDAFVEALTELI